MRASCSAFLAAALAALAPAAASATEASTTRIETRPFYGATVTLESGVRVFRPLPPHGKVIINPGGKTPVSLGFEENRYISHNYNYNSEPAFEAPFVDGGFGAGFIDDGHRRRHRPFRHRGGFNFRPGGKH